MGPACETGVPKVSHFKVLNFKAQFPALHRYPSLGEPGAGSERWSGGRWLLPPPSPLPSVPVPPPPHCAALSAPGLFLVVAENSHRSWPRDKLIRGGGGGGGGSSQTAAQQTFGRRDGSLQERLLRRSALSIYKGWPRGEMSSGGGGWGVRRAPVRARKGFRVWFCRGSAARLG